jgi:hypothetical protein
MSAEFDVYFIPAPDKEARAGFFNDDRVKSLVGVVNYKTIDYLAEVIFRFTTKRLFDTEFDAFEIDAYNQNSDESIFDYAPYLRSIYKEANIGTLGNLRASILERLVFQFKKPFYNDHASWIDTFGYVANKDLKSSSSIDVAAWSQARKRGECTECAVNITFVKEESKKEEFRELQRIIKLISNRLNSYFVCFAKTAVLEQTVGKFSDVELIGRDRLANYLGIKS